MMAIVKKKITNCISTRSTSSLAFGGGSMDGWGGEEGGGRARWLGMSEKGIGICFLNYFLKVFMFLRFLNF